MRMARLPELCQPTGPHEMSIDIDTYQSRRVPGLKRTGHFKQKCRRQMEPAAHPVALSGRDTTRGCAQCGIGCLTECCMTSFGRARLLWITHKAEHRCMATEPQHP